MSTPLETRFWSKVWRCTHRTCQRCCWLWKPSIARALYEQTLPWYRPSSSWSVVTMYGIFLTPDGQSYPAHRFARILHDGALFLPFSRRDMHVCHHCDCGSCCNPRHLFVGTPRDNCRDFSAKRLTLPMARLLLPNGQSITREQRLTEDLLIGVGPLHMPRLRGAYHPLDAPNKDSNAA